MITRRENLLRVLRGEKPEWIPVVGHCDPYSQPNKRGMDPALAKALADVKWCDESTVAYCRYLGLDIADRMQPPIIARQEKVVVHSSRNGDARITVWQTSSGELRQVERFSQNTNLWYTAEHMVKTAADLPIMTEIFADTKYEPAPDAARIVKKRRDLIGDDGILIHTQPGTPLGQMVRVHSGVETIAYLWADAPKELRDLFAVMEDSFLRRQKLSTAMDCDAVITMDDTSTTTISPRLFEEYCLSNTDRMAEAAHKDGKFYMHHSCGLIHDLLGLYRRTKMDAVQAFMVPPIGDVTVAQGRKLLGRDITICPTLCVMFCDMSDRQAAAANIKKVFEEATPGDHFIVWLSADPGKTMDDTAFVFNECRKYQRL